MEQSCQGLYGGGFDLSSVIGSRERESKLDQRDRPLRVQGLGLRLNKGLGFTRCQLQTMPSPGSNVSSREDIGNEYKMSGRSSAILGGKSGWWLLIPSLYIWHV